MYFREDQVEDLRAGFGEVQAKFTQLQKRIVLHAFQSAGAREHADHGLARRLGTMVRCVEQVFHFLPPDLTEIPDRETTIDATVNIQAFVMNAFGCCENLAWIWVHERDVRRPNGNNLRPAEVGLGPGYVLVRTSLSDGFRQYLDGLQEWFANLKSFRDALAHQIPLYIPPFTVNPADWDRFQALDAAANQSLRDHDFEGRERQLDEQMALARFQPVMTHSLAAGANVVVFHPQLLADFNTIHQMAGILLDALDG